MNKLKFSGKTKIYFQTIGLLGIFLLLFLVIYRLTISQIPLQKSRLSEQTRKEQTLRQKGEILRTLDQSVLGQVDLTAFALPNKNSSFIVASQVNRVASENSVFITNLRIGSETEDASLLSSDLSFDVEGATPLVLNFLQAVGNIAPITLIDRVQINQTAQVARATVRLKVFWANFPTSLPPVTEAISDLTQEEEEVLISILNLTPPEFVELEAQPPTERADPF